MKKLQAVIFILGLVLAMPLSAIAAPTSKFKQFIIPLECTVDIIDIGPGDPYASIQPEDCEDPEEPPIIPTPPLPPGVPPFNNLLPYYPRALTVDDFDLNGYTPPSSGIGFDFDEFNSSFVMPFMIIMLVLLLFALLVLLYGHYHRRQNDSNKKPKH